MLETLLLAYSGGRQFSAVTRSGVAKGGSYLFFWNCLRNVSDNECGAVVHLFPQKDADSSAPPPLPVSYFFHPDGHPFFFRFVQALELSLQQSQTQ